MPVQTEVPQDAALRKNIASFESASDWLVEHHNAKWVIFHDATFVAPSTRLTELLARPFANLGRGHT